MHCRQIRENSLCGNGGVKPGISQRDRFPAHLKAIAYCQYSMAEITVHLKKVKKPTVQVF
ncbi:MAG TPA: hypothetical protein V6C85_17040 [Allocoleopsis sp.]